MSPKTEICIFAILSGILFLAPIRAGDLPGYDDARYALVAKGAALSGDWLNLESNGYPDLEHPPLFEWMQAASFDIFDLTDAAARLPSALLGWGAVLLTAWLCFRLTGDARQSLIALIAMAGSAYFVKYAARAMTDAPVTFFFAAALCAWSLAAESPLWYLAAGACTAMALMTRGFIGLALPAIFALDLLIRRRRPPLLPACAALAIALAPIAAWYGYLIHVYGDWYFTVHAQWLHREVTGPLSPAWRRYTGLFEYLWMLAKSYWPWLPFSVAGAVFVVRARDRGLYILLAWFAVVLAMCAVPRSRVLRYMLPAYPALAILAAIGLTRLVAERYIDFGLRIVTPIVAVGVLAIALFPPVSLHASEIRPIAAAATSATKENERVAFYDAGQSRFDETNQMQWYGDRNLYILEKPADLTKMLQTGGARVFVVDEDTYRAQFDGRRPNRIVARGGHLICLRLDRSD